MAASYPASVKSFGAAVVDGVTDVLAAHVNDLREEVVAIETQLILPGWMAVTETWTYASATTFTVSGDQTAKYRVGTRIRLTQTTVKYFYVKAVSYSAPNTTVTVTAGIDYSLANAAITSPYFSYSVNPQGFPNGFNWTPTVTGMTVVGGPPIYTGKIWLIGKLLRAQVIINPNTGSTASTLITTYVDNLPFAAGSYGTSETLDAVSFADLGQGVFSPSLARLYLPTWTTNSHLIHALGWIEVA